MVAEKKFSLESTVEAHILLGLEFYCFLKQISKELIKSYRHLRNITNQPCLYKYLRLKFVRDIIYLIFATNEN